MRSVTEKEKLKMEHSLEKNDAKGPYTITIPEGWDEHRVIRDLVHKALMLRQHTRTWQKVYGVHAKQRKELAERALDDFLYRILKVPFEVESRHKGIIKHEE